MLTVLNINMSRIDSAHLYEGKKGSYLSCVLSDATLEPDQYGNSGYVRQDVGREARERGEKGAIIGNYKIVGHAKPSHPKQDTTQKRTYKPTTPAAQDPKDDIPF